MQKEPSKLIIHIIAYGYIDNNRSETSLVGVQKQYI